MSAFLICSTVMLAQKGRPTDITHMFDGLQPTLSRLRPMPSDLASACFLTHGLPDTVAGVSFMYSYPPPRESEDYLHALLTDSRMRTTPFGLALRYLARRVFVLQNGKVFLAFDPSSRLAYLEALQSSLSRGGGLTKREERLTRVLRFYYGNHSQENLKTVLAHLAASGDPLSRIYRRNLLDVAKRLSNRASVPQERPYPLR